MPHGTSLTGALILGATGLVSGCPCPPGPTSPRSACGWEGGHRLAWQATDPPSCPSAICPYCQSRCLSVLPAGLEGPLLVASPCPPMSRGSLWEGEAVGSGKHNLSLGSCERGTFWGGRPSSSAQWGPSHASELVHVKHLGWSSAGWQRVRDGRRDNNIVPQPVPGLFPSARVPDHSSAFALGQLGRLLVQRPFQGCIFGPAGPMNCGDCESPGAQGRGEPPGLGDEGDSF